MSHIAIVRSSSRAAQQQHKSESTPDPTSNRRPSTTSGPNPDSFVDRFSGLSIISLSSSEDIDVATSSTSIVRSRSNQTFTGSTSPSRMTKSSPKLVMASLDRLETLADVEACVDRDLYQVNVLSKLDQTWSKINSNFEQVLQHLQECSEEVTQASNDCLRSLVDSIETCCDSVDEEVKAFYHLMTKCDELTTKLSIAGTFRDEIKTLKKSVETLEHLYKSRPQVHQVSNR